MKTCHIRLMPGAHLVEKIAQRRRSNDIRGDTGCQGSCPKYLQSNIMSVRSNSFHAPNITLMLSTSKIEVKANL